MQALCKYEERVHRVALVVRPLGVVSVRRKGHFEIGKEPGLAISRKDIATVVVLCVDIDLVERNPVQRPVHEFVIIHNEADHADGSV